MGSFPGLSGFPGLPGDHHRDPYKRDPRGVRVRRKDDVTMEADTDGL